MAKYIKTVKNAAGDKVDIVIEISTNYGYITSKNNSDVRIEIVDLNVRKFKHKKWEYISQYIQDAHEYRRLPLGYERKLYTMRVFLQYITPEQAKEAIAEAYAAIAPDTEIIDKAWRML